MAAADQDIIIFRLLSSENMQIVWNIQMCYTSNYGGSLMQMNSSTVPIFMYTWCNFS